MAFSVFLRPSLFKGHILKSAANQVLRSSSICTVPNDPKSHQLTRTNINAGEKQLLMPRMNSTGILAKYFAATKALQSAEGGHDHVKIWKFERLLSIGLLPLIPAALIAPNQVLDTIVAVGIVMHTHWGLEAIVVDYVRPILFGEIGPKIGMGLLYIFSAVTLAGCLNLIFNDVGLANAFREIWKL